MKSDRYIIAIMLAVWWVTAVSSCYAASLREDYRQMVVERQVLEKERRQHEAASRKLSAKRRKLHSELMQCISATWVPELEDSFRVVHNMRNELEEDRTALIRLREQLDIVRKEMEEIRAAIEAKYRKKSRSANYENEFRQYMAVLKEQYFKRMEIELFTGYREYLVKVEQYLQIIGTCIHECRGE